VDTAALRALLDFDTPTVGNGLELLAVRDPSAGYTGPDVHALMPDMGVRAGIAVTARLDTTSPGTDSTTMDLFWDMVRHVEQLSGSATATNSSPGGAAAVPVFVVIESVGLRPRYTVTIGDGMGTHLRNAGAVGYLTNGSIRDLAGVRAVPLPCWAAGVSPMHGRLRWLDWGSPIVVDGMTVRTGDVIHADENGALCFPAHLTAAVLEKAHAVREKESRMFETLRQPGMTADKYLKSLAR
jgi:4-hydroxy-4-methyl-2-oxoglutarate aldolase